jgi:hypothetical protein
MWRIVRLGISGGRWLTRPFRDAHRFPPTRWYPVPGATHTPLGFGLCPSFKGHFLSPRAKPNITIRNLFIILNDGGCLRSLSRLHWGEMTLQGFEEHQ